MPTGACGVDCDVCKLRVLEICSTCGPGRSSEAVEKLDAQKRLMGNTCPILSCAAMSQIDYCLRDCAQFPCVNFRSGPYPYGEGFLAMQERRRAAPTPGLTHNRARIVIPQEYWEHVAGNLQSIAACVVGATIDPRGGIQLPSLNDQIWVDTAARRVCRLRKDRRDTLEDELFQLVTLLYLMNVKPDQPTKQDLVGVSDLREAHYFREHHALDLGGLLDRYGNDVRGFRGAALFLGGEPLDLADAAFKLLPFPGIPIYYLLWEGDEEFQPKISILFDRTIEQVFSASGIWSLVKVVSRRLLLGPRQMASE
jgi:hypothetical protein